MQINPRLLRIGIVAFAYGAAAILGDSSGLILFGNLTLFWPPSGIALFAILVFGSEILPGIFIGSFLGNLFAFYHSGQLGIAVLANLGVAAGSTFQAWLGGYLLRRSGCGRDFLDRAADVLRFVFLAGILSSTISALVATPILTWAGFNQWANFWPFGWTWWLGDATGILVVTPLLWVWLRKPWTWKGHGTILEAVGLLFLLGLAGQVVFSLFGGPSHHFALAHLFLPTLVWATLRFGAHGAVTTVFLVYLMAMVATPLGRGPFATDSPGLSVLLLQVFLADLCLTTLSLLAVLTERESRNRLLLEERQARIEAQASVQLRDDFISIASHELRTPLTPLKIYSQLMRRQLKENEPREPSNHAKLSQIMESSEVEIDRLSKLVENLLDVSRISAGRLILDPEEFDLSQVVRQVAERFAPELSLAKCDLRLSCQPVTGVWDRLRVEQAFVNLLTNAFKYGVNHPIEVSLESDGTLAKLIVRDHGIGIAQEQQDRIFGRFERVAPLKNFAGLGLGLFITREIVQAHGGKIHVKSASGQGAAFIMELPLRNLSLSAKGPELGPA